MKKMIFSILSILTISLGVSSQVLVSSININGANGLTAITTEGGNLQMEVTVYPANATNTNCIWSVNNIGMANAFISPTGLLTGVVPGVVEVIATAEDGSGAVAYMSVDLIFSVSVSSIDVSSTNGATTINTAQGVLFMNADIQPYYADNQSITWSLVNGTGSATISSSGTLTAQANGTVEVVATSNDGSNVEGTVTITISNQSLSVNEYNVSSQVSIYPNPVLHDLFVEVNDTEIIKITILDYSGQLVKAITNNMTNQIDVSDLKQGVYILSVHAQNGISNTRFVKQ
jgi:hypothetical protein